MMVAAMPRSAPAADPPAPHRHKGTDAPPAGRATVLPIPERGQAITPPLGQPVLDDLRPVSTRGLPVWWKLLILARRNCR